MDKKVILFDLRDISPEDIEEELGPSLADPGYIVQLESALADFIGKIVEVTFKEKKIKRCGTERSR